MVEPRSKEGMQPKAPVDLLGKRFEMRVNELQREYARDSMTPAQARAKAYLVAEFEQKVNETFNKINKKEGER